jgi:hypothetical protein
MRCTSGRVIGLMEILVPYLRVGQTCGPNLILDRRGGRANVVEIRKAPSMRDVTTSERRDSEPFENPGFRLSPGMINRLVSFGLVAQFNSIGRPVPPMRHGDSLVG